MKVLINQNVNYANHTNSSAPGWDNSSAKSDSLSTIIRNKTIIVKEALSENQTIIREKQLIG